MQVKRRCLVCSKHFSFPSGHGNQQKCCSKKCRHVRHWFLVQRTKAAERGIAWKLTFEQWLDIWKNSGHLQNRGKGAGKYVMARHQDHGLYEVGNVSIISNAKNVSDGNIGKVISRKTRKRMSAARSAYWAMRRNERPP